MASEDADSLDQAASARRERLRALRAAQQLSNTPDDDDDDDANKIPDNDETNHNIKFRNYVPHDKQLQEGKVTPPVLPEFEDPVVVAPPSEPTADPFVNIAPKKPNWDLRRDVEKKLDKLDRRTHKALYKLMEQQLEQKEPTDDGLQSED